MYKPYSTNTQSLLEKIDELKNGSVDEEAEERNERIIEEWEEMDRCIQASLETIQTSINTLTGNGKFDFFCILTYFTLFSYKDWKVMSTSWEKSNLF